MGRTHRILHALPITGFVAEVHERLNTCDPIEPEHTIDQFTAMLIVDDQLKHQNSHSDNQAN